MLQSYLHFMDCLIYISFTLFYLHFALVIEFKSIHIAFLGYTSVLASYTLSAFRFFSLGSVLSFMATTFDRSYGYGGYFTDAVLSYKEAGTTKINH